MWLPNFSDRLTSWNHLRSQCQQGSVDSALSTINDWWFQAPWKPYYLHWDDQRDWPDPWQLLSDNWYCDLARGLGILYTITLLDRADLTSARLVLTDSGDNLVLVEKEKYILNWDPDAIVNTIQAVKIKREYSLDQAKTQYL
jgi:hypothetical protein